MRLSTGARLGPYQIEAPLGAGGMGEVYRARDTRLGRTVAIKISRERFSDRFQREARTIAGLNHPNICTLHDVGPDYLVMEYIDGKPLHGPLPVATALRYTAQICEALDTAHRQGITHRDLKPANILVTSAGVKLLDFGLAKIQPEPVNDETVPLEQALTSQGVIVGTPNYMAPEQVEGKQVDARSDIFALGCVIYEMITGNKAFRGASTASLIAAILKDDPAPLTEFSSSVPASLERVVKRCLAKDPESRWQNVRDLKHALEDVREQEPLVQPAVKARRWIFALAAMALLAVLGWLFEWGRQPAAEARSYRLSINPPTGAAFSAGPNRGGPAVSPDGRTLAFVAVRAGQTSLWVRPLDSSAARELAGTEEAHYPFWSPDSRSLAFFTSDKLKRIDAGGGPAQTLSDATVGRGGDWSPDGTTILFSPTTDSPLYRLPAAGGDTVQVTTLDTASGENSHRFPQFLPDGKRFLYTSGSSKPGAGGLYAGSLDDPKYRVRLMPSAYTAIYAPPLASAPGYLLWARDQSMVAQPWDAKRLRATGDAVPVPDLAGFLSVRTELSISQNGVMVEGPHEALAMQVAWFSREGKALETLGEPDFYGSPRLSPDGRKIAVERGGLRRPAEIWILDLQRGVSSRLTLGPGGYRNPIWSPDGTRLAFSGERSGLLSSMVIKDANGAGPEEKLAQSGRSLQVTDWSRDGRRLLFSYLDDTQGQRSDLWVLPLDGERKAQRITGAPAGAIHGQLSSDGKWLAYASKESGRFEVYVRAFPAGAQRWQVSSDGGNFPHWRRDGKELFYVGRSSKLTAVSVKTGASTLEFEAPHAMFPLPILYASLYAYDVSADGQRFLAIIPSAKAERDTMTAIINWQAALKR